MIDLNEYYTRAEYGDDEHAKKLHDMIRYGAENDIIVALKYHEYVHLMGVLRKVLFKGAFAGLRSG